LSFDQANVGDPDGWSGTVVALYVAECAGVEMHEVEAAELIAGTGVAGDRYALDRGHYSHRWHPDRQLTLIAQEVIDKVAADIEEPVAGSELRRNVVTRDVPLNDLVSRVFKIGPAIVYGGRLNVPCRYLERLIGKPVFEPLIGRSGLNCQILSGGLVHPGDVVGPATPAEAEGVKALIAAA
jgi:MOSC domain-containing protein YiiM